jgi:hypothetical protein
MNELNCYYNSGINDLIDFMKDLNIGDVDFIETYDDLSENKI